MKELLTSNVLELILFIIGPIVSFMGWRLKAWSKSKDRRRDVELTLQIDKLNLEIQLIEKEVTIRELKDTIILEEYLTMFVDRFRANYAHISVIKNGGDHITSRKDCNVTIIYEKHHHSKEPMKDQWQGVRIQSQLAKILLEVVTKQFHYIHNFVDNMEEGAIKDIVNPMDGLDLAWYYIGKLGVEEYILSFQFRNDRSGFDYDKSRIQLYASSIYSTLKETYKLREEYKLMLDSKTKLHTKLLENRIK